jgi:hypothetical protein
VVEFTHLIISASIALRKKTCEDHCRDGAPALPSFSQVVDLGQQFGADIRDPTKLADAIGEEAPKIVFRLAAQPVVRLPDKVAGAFIAISNRDEMRREQIDVISIYRLTHGLFLQQAMAEFSLGERGEFHPGGANIRSSRLGTLSMMSATRSRLSSFTFSMLSASKPTMRFVIAGAGLRIYFGRAMRGAVFGGWRAKPLFGRSSILYQSS